MEYRPPSETLPIFDSSVFRNRNASLTFDEARKYFLEFPRAQGPETLQTTTITGPLTCSSTATFGTAGSADNIPTCISDYSTVSSADSSDIIPTTAWTQTAIAAGSSLNLLPLDNTWTGTNTFNDNVNLNTNLTLEQGAFPPRSITFSDGTVQTTASTGGALLGQYAEPPYYVACGDPNFQVNTNYFITFPPNARTATISIFGGGGKAGTITGYDGTYYYAPGQGGAGGYISMTFDIGPNANTISSNPSSQILSYSYSNTNTTGQPSGNTVYIGWYPDGAEKYNPTIFSSIGQYNIGFAYCGNDGTNGSNSGVVGTSGTGGLASGVPAANSFAQFNYIDGAPAPPPPAPFIPSTVITAQGGQNVCADLRTTLTSSWCKGGTTTYPGDGSFSQTIGTGGILMEFFT